MEDLTKYQVFSPITNLTKDQVEQVLAKILHSTSDEHILVIDSPCSASSQNDEIVGPRQDWVPAQEPVRTLRSPTGLCKPQRCKLSHSAYFRPSNSKTVSPQRFLTQRLRHWPKNSPRSSPTSSSPRKSINCQRNLVAPKFLIKMGEILGFEKVFVHGDFWPANLMWDCQNGETKVAKLIDFQVGILLFFGKQSQNIDVLLRTFGV